MATPTFTPNLVSGMRLLQRMLFSQNTPAYSNISTQCEHHLPCVISSYAGLSKVLQAGSGGDANGVLSSRS